MGKRLQLLFLSCFGWTVDLLRFLGPKWGVFHDFSSEKGMESGTQDAAFPIASYHQQTGYPDPWSIVETLSLANPESTELQFLRYGRAGRAGLDTLWTLGVLPLLGSLFISWNTLHKQQKRKTWDPPLGHVLVPVRFHLTGTRIDQANPNGGLTYIRGNGLKGFGLVDGATRTKYLHGRCAYQFNIFRKFYFFFNLVFISTKSI